MALNLCHESVWLDKSTYEDAERVFYENKAKPSTNNNECSINTNKALEGHIHKLEKIIETFERRLNNVIDRVQRLEQITGDYKPIHAVNLSNVPKLPKEQEQPEDDDDGVDLFGSDSEEDEAAMQVRQKRLADYEAKKSKKPVLIAKSNIILDVKPWDDETDMKRMEEAVRGIQTEGLVWGAAKLVPLAYGIHKLQISCVVEDDLVSVDWLQEQLEEISDFVQSVDIAAFNKV